MPITDFHTKSSTRCASLRPKHTGEPNILNSTRRGGTSNHERDMSTGSNYALENFLCANHRLWSSLM
jgi:hypothetical protein